MMHLLFKNIPIGTKDYELADFIKHNFNHLYSKKLSLAVSGIEILERQDNYSRPIEQFGVIRISPDNVAKAIILELNNCFFGSLKITVREYFNRSENNDPRINSSNLPKAIIDQRKSDRRNHILMHSRQI